MLYLSNQLFNSMFMIHNTNITFELVFKIIVVGGVGQKVYWLGGGGC